MSDSLQVKVIYTGFEEPVLGFEEPVLGFASFDQFEEPVLGFEKLRTRRNEQVSISVRNPKHNLGTFVGNLEIAFTPDTIPPGNAGNLTGRLTVTKPGELYLVEVSDN